MVVFQINGSTNMIVRILLSRVRISRIIQQLKLCPLATPEKNFFLVYSVKCTVYTVYSVQCIQFTVYSVYSTLYSVQCKVYSVQFTVYSVRYTV